MLPLNNQKPSVHLFSIFTRLINLAQQQTSPYGNNSTKQQLMLQLEEDFAKTAHVTANQTKYETLLFHWLKSMANNQISSITQPSYAQKQQGESQTSFQKFKAFLQHFSETRMRILNIDNIVQNMTQIKLVALDKKKLCTLKDQIFTKNQNSKFKASNNTSSSVNTQKERTSEDQLTYKAYVIYGKAINVQKKKKTNSESSEITTNVSFQDMESKQQVTSQIQFCMTKMYEDQRIPFVKSEPHELDDLLLAHQLDNISLLPILVANQVYRLFIPLDFVVLMVIPDSLSETTKMEIPSVIKSTLLHVYIQNFKCLSRLISKQILYKNSTFRGIYFVQEGEVETKIGRIVAKGWVINGKCKSTSQVWRFTKVMPFFKFIIQNQNIWKQFINDLKLNGQWPIKVADVLNLEEKYFQEIMGHQGSGSVFGNNQRNNRKLKFPPISGRLNKSFDLNKLSEIQKVKHFDQKMNHLYIFKEEMLKKKLQINLRRNSLYGQNQASSEASQRQMNKKIKYLSQKYSISQKGLKTDVSRSVILRPGESSANILVTGIVNKLKSMHESTAEESLALSGRGSSNSKKNLVEMNKSQSKILGLKRYEQLMKKQKNHRYKGKNTYH